MDDRLPFDFIVEGIPRSSQSKRGQARWKDAVARAAESDWQGGLLNIGHIRVVIVYYFKDGSLDVDNMIKPILDALKMVIYEDDNVIDEVTARKTELVSGLQIAGASASLIGAINAETDFVYVRVDGGPNHEIIP